MINKIITIENEIEIFDENSENEIMIFEEKKKIKQAIIFTPQGMEKVLNLIEKKAREKSPDASTKKGQIEIKSIAATVAKCKAPLEKIAKDLKEDHRKIINHINEQRDNAVARLDALRDEIRKPVDEIEEREAAQLKAWQDRLTAMENLRISTNGLVISSCEFDRLINEVKNFLNFEWGNFQFKAETLADELISFFETRKYIAKQAEAEAAELMQLRKEAAERAKKDHEEKIAKEAAEKEKLEAQRLAEIEKRKVETEKIEAEAAAKKREEKIEADKKAAEQAKIEAENRLIEAEKLAKEQALRVELAKIEAEKKAKEEAEKAVAEAVKKEQERVEAKRLADEAEAIKIAQNKEHVKNINDEAAKALSKVATILFEDAKIIIEAIAKNEIPHLKINY